MSPDGEFLKVSAVRFVRALPGPIETVWAHLTVLERFEPQNAMGWATFLDILDDTLHGRPVEPRPAYMQRNAARYGVELSNLAR